MTSTDIPEHADRENGSVWRDRRGFGERLKALRKSYGWTLIDLAERSGVAVSTISKAERGQISLTYDSILKLAYGFSIEMSELISDVDDDSISQEVTVERGGQAQRLENDYYICDMLCSARVNKHMVPVHARIKAHSIEDFARFIQHPGEEFVYVLEGRLAFHIDGQPTRYLSPGDSVYFDSRLGHAYVSAGDTDAVLIVVCWHPQPNDIEVRKLYTGHEEFRSAK